MAHEATVKERMRILEQTSRNVAKLSAAMKNYDMGIIPEPIDTSSTYEKLQEKLYTDQDLRKKVYNLFNNDTTTSEDFLELFEEKNISYSDFITVYQQLLQQFKGFLASPSVVMDVMIKLIKNVKTTGVPSSSGLYEELREAQDILEDQFRKSNLSKKEGDDMVDKLNAINEILTTEDDLTEEELNVLMTSISYRRARDFLNISYNNITKIVTGDMDSDLKLEKLTKELSGIKYKTFEAVRKERLKKKLNEKLLTDQVTRENNRKDKRTIKAYIAEKKKKITVNGKKIKNKKEEITEIEKAIQKKKNKRGLANQQHKINKLLNEIDDIRLENDQLQNEIEDALTKEGFEDEDEDDENIDEKE